MDANFQLGLNDFELFGLPVSPNLSLEALQVRRRVLLKRVHPDRLGRDSAMDQVAAAQWTARVNQGHQRLRDPVQRLVYLAELRGIGVRDHLVLPPEMLGEQMDLRETLEALNSDLAGLQSLREQVRMGLEAHWQQAAGLLDGGGAGLAVAVARLLFDQRLLQQIDGRLAGLRASSSRVNPAVA